MSYVTYIYIYSYKYIYINTSSLHIHLKPFSTWVGLIFAEQTVTQELSVAKLRAKRDIQPLQSHSTDSKHG